MTFTSEQMKMIKNSVKSVVDQVLQNSKKNEAEDNPEFIASEIIDLTEWLASEIEMQKPIAKLVLEAHPWPNGVSVLIKRHFSLPY